MKKAMRKGSTVVLLAMQHVRSLGTKAPKFVDLKIRIRGRKGGEAGMFKY